MTMLSLTLFSNQPFVRFCPVTEAEAFAEAINSDTGRVAKKVRQERKQRLADAYQNDRAQRVVIDCSFDDVMTERELVSFRHQIRLACTEPFSSPPAQLGAVPIVTLVSYRWEQCTSRSSSEAGVDRHE